MIAVAVVVVAVAGSVGVAGRHLPASHEVVKAETAAESFDALQSRGVRGAVLVSIDDESPIIPELYLCERIGGFGSIESSSDAFARDYDLVAALVEAGIAREVYQVVPDDAWPELASRLSGTSVTIDEGRTYRRRLYGAQITYTRAADLKLPAEKVVVVAETPVVARFAPAFIERLTGADVAALVVEKAQVNR